MRKNMFLKRTVHFIKYVYKAPRIIRNHLYPKTIILLYHRVISLEKDPQELAVSHKNFRAHLQYLKENYSIISLDQLINSLKKGKVPQKSVVITFDDGYVDNYLYAKTILEELGVPATFFVSTENIGTNNEFWWDSLERVFLLGKSLPKSLELKFNNRKHIWKLHTLEQKKETYCQIHNLLLQAKDSEIKETIHSLLTCMGLKNNARKNYRAMNRREISELVKKGIISIGSHGHFHCRLSSQSKAAQRESIIKSKRMLEGITHAKIKHFSYPFGGKGDYTSATIQLLKANGFQTSCANHPSLVSEKSNLFELPRFIVRDWDAKRFAKEIRKFFYLY